MRTVYGLAIAALCIACAASVFAGDIVTVPTANQLKTGEFDVAGYYIGVDKRGNPGPDWIHAETLYYGVTDDFEVDLHFYQVDKVVAGGAVVQKQKDSVVLIASYRLLAESPKTPIVVIGGRNLTKSTTCYYPGTVTPTKDRSWYVSAAKTINPPGPGGPKWPIVRLHLSVGTADNTLFAADRHKGLFGGVQLRLSPQVGLVALHDSRDLITGLTYDPIKELTIKGGTYGTHWWLGVSYAKSFK
jgi:hypothetical protein